MKRQPLRARLILTVLLGICLPATSQAAGSTAPGFYLRWEQCYTDGGAANRVFACDTNAGTSMLVLSFELAQAMTDVSGLELIVDFATPEPVLPAWWQFKNTGSCRQTSLTMVTGTPPGAGNCTDWGAGQSAGGIATYSVPFNVSTDRQRLIMATAVPASAITALAAAQEYVACLLYINHQKTVGTGACVGCASPACIQAQRIKITTNTPGGSGDRVLSLPADGPGSERVTWQDGAFTEMTTTCGQLGCFTDFTCTSVTPARGSTWGAVKALYR